MGRHSVVLAVLLMVLAGAAPAFASAPRWQLSSSSAPT